MINGAHHFVGQTGYFNNWITILIVVGTFPVEDALYFENFDLDSVVTPVDADRLQQLLIETSYNKNETEFIVDGFRYGFDIGFRGSIKNQRRFAPNLKLRLGNEVNLWNKIMKEVKNKRYAGPYQHPPFKEFIQSPVGLVPKDGGKETRLIFHLSYPRNGMSVNSQTPKEMCTVQYCDFADAIRRCMEEGNGLPVFVGKSDMKSAFRNLGLRPSQFCLMVIKAVSPFDGQTYYFVDKCLPFGASVSCSHFQKGF